MDNDDLREEEKKSLLKDMAKKGISKKIKTIPLGTKVLIISIFGIAIFLLVFTVLSTVLSMLLLFDFDGNENSAEFTYISNNSEDNYWWPIGGNEVSTLDGKKYAIGEPTSTNISSYYDLNRVIIKDGVEHKSPHRAIDIGPSGGTDYIISVAKGVVKEVNDTCDNNGAFEVEGVSDCGGSYGNYVLIEHAGGTSTRYAHMYPKSITVSVGEVVQQGQIIGIMGNSGNTTGTHLHFEVIDANNNKINPLNYVSNTEFRPVTINSGYSGGNNLLNMIQSFEGTGPTDGDYYLVYKDSGGVLTVGYGVTLVNHAPKFAERGIDINELTVNSPIKKTIVDDIKLEIIDGFSSTVKNTISNAGITLQDYQIDALTSRAYNTGNIVGFVTAYKKYGNTEALYDNYMSTPITDKKGTKLPGLRKRRDAEWKLFNTGIYP